MKLKNLSESLANDLRNPDYAADYLLMCLEADETNATFLMALKTLAEAHGGMSSLARATALNRENLYSALSNKGHPRLNTLRAILKELGIRMTFEPIQPTEQVA